MFGHFESRFRRSTSQEQSPCIDLINNAIAINSSDWFVGDTGKDIETGKSLGMQTAAVLYGFLNKEKLIEYKPDLIINTVIDFKPINK